MYCDTPKWSKFTQVTSPLQSQQQCGQKYDCDIQDEEFVRFKVSCILHIVLFLVCLYFLLEILLK